MRNKLPYPKFYWNINSIILSVTFFFTDTNILKFKEFVRNLFLNGHKYLEIQIVSPLRFFLRT